jgi:hypothetical protein
MSKKELDVLDKFKSLETYAYKEREFNIADVKIILAPLTAGETIEVFESSDKYNDPDASAQALKVETLARSIIIINDVKFGPTSYVAEKLQIVKSFSDELIDIMFNEYCMLDMTVKNSITERLMKENFKFDSTQQEINNVS